jgi:protein phosphatase 1L
MEDPLKRVAAKETVIKVSSFGLAESVGGRRSMEDASIANPNFYLSGFYGEPGAMFLVCDGHGLANGERASEYVKDNLPEEMLENLEPSDNLTPLITKAFESTDQKMQGDSELDDTGTTACLVLVEGGNLIVANCGDTEAILVRNDRAETLTTSHKAYLEADRIIGAGGVMARGKVKGSSGAWNAVGRSLGEKTLGKPFVIATPSVNVASLQSHDTRVIIATDGLWDEIKPDEALKIIKDIRDPQQAADKLLDEAVNERYSRDNVSVIVINLENSGDVINESVEEVKEEQDSQALKLRGLEETLARNFPYEEYERKFFRAEMEKVLRNALSNPEIQSRRNALLEIANKGTLDGVRIPDPIILGSGHHSVENMWQRVYFVEIYTHNPELAHLMVENQIVGCHGSASGSLMGVLEHGLRPQNYLREHQVPIATGEGFYGSADLNDIHVSFFNIGTRSLRRSYLRDLEPITEEKLEKQIEKWKNIPPGGMHYNSLQLKLRNTEETLKFLRKENKTEEENLVDNLIRRNFPVAYFVKDKSFDKQSDTRGTELDGEYAVKNGISREGVGVIGVPDSEVEFVQKLVVERNLNIKVISLDRYRSA